MLKQKTRKQNTIEPCWASLYYAVDLGPVHGAAIYLYANDYPLVSRWSKHLKVDCMQELDRLEEEADESHFDGRHHRLTFGPEAVRKVQLYRSLAHEVGHLVHYQREVDIPAKMDSEDLELWERLHDAFFCRAQREREDFAHRYSVTWRRRLVEQGIIPFDRQADAEAMRAEGLDPSDFGSS